jgi:hypothetical protein
MQHPKPQHPVVLWEIGTPNARALGGFYAELFGWHVDTSNPGWVRVTSGARETLDGGISQTTGQAPYLTFYVEVEDLDAYLDRARALGATIEVPPTAIAGGGEFAMIVDPGGHRVGLLHDREKKPHPPAASL